MATKAAQQPLLTALDNASAQLTRLQQSSVSGRRVLVQQRRLAQRLAANSSASGDFTTALGKPLQAVFNAYADADHSQRSLNASLLQGDGQLPAQLPEITALSQRLGEQLPGSQADYQELMVQLRSRGVSAQSLLDGTGAATAFYSVARQQPVAQSAALAVVLQRASGSTAQQMPELLDLAQRAGSMGLDENSLAQGLRVLPKDLPQRGVANAQAMTPLLLQLNQANLSGDEAGQTLRQVLQGSQDASRVALANQQLKALNAGVQLDFATHAQAASASSLAQQPLLSQLQQQRHANPTQEALDAAPVSAANLRLPQANMQGDQAPAQQRLLTQLQQQRQANPAQIALNPAPAALLNQASAAAAPRMTTQRADESFASAGSAAAVSTSVAPATSVARLSNSGESRAQVERLLSQLQKLQPLSVEQRTPVLQTLFEAKGQSLDGINALIDGGLVGYQQLATQLAQQASLEARVSAQLGGFSQTLETTQARWNEVLVALGETVAPEMQQALEQLGELAVGVRDWIKDNPQLTALLLKTAATLYLIGQAALWLKGVWSTLSLAFDLLRLATSLFSNQGLAMLQRLLSLLSRAGLSLMRTVLGVVAEVGAMLLTQLANLVRLAVPVIVQGLRLIAMAALSNPVLAIIAGIALAATLIYSNWDSIGPYFSQLWNELKAGFSGGLGDILQTLANFSPQGLFYRAFTKVLEYFGIELPETLSALGGVLVDSLFGGLQSRFNELLQWLSNAAGSVSKWFNQTFGVQLQPSLAALPRAPADGSTIALDRPSEGLRLQATPAFRAGASAAPVIQGDTISIQLNAPAVSDPNALREQLNQLLGERERQKFSRLRATLSDNE